MEFNTYMLPEIFVRRYFIVVDDLWEMEAWDAIECAFPQNNYCCRVMITTRNEKVARRCCDTSGIIHHMKPLSEPDSRKLFFTRIFGTQDDCPSGFEEVSCAILKRCGGLPLAIITIAGILASQQTQLKVAWEYIQTALAPELESNIDYENMMYILDLSYKHLPLHPLVHQGFFAPGWKSPLVPVFQPGAPIWH